MAFFVLEDKFASIECIAFPKVYERFSSHIRTDAAVTVSGTVSMRDDEVKILVNAMQELIENDSYRETTPVVPKTPEVQSKQTANSVSKGAPLTLHEGGKLFVRVPSLESELAKKAKNLVELFEGTTQVLFYDTEKGTYSSFSARFDLTPFTFAEMKALLGEENVIYH
jgi:DNA polymerase-3 subunit alpha